MNKYIEFTVWGKPYGQKRPRAFRRGKFLGIYSPKENVDYAKKVIDAYNNATGVVDTEYLYDENTPVSVHIKAYFVRGKVTKKELANNAKKYVFPIKKADADNIAKGILDALTQAKAWKDDAQVVELIIEKLYDEEESVYVQLYEKVYSDD